MNPVLKVITLDRTPWRFEAFRRASPNIPVERISACDGSRLNVAACVRSGLFSETLRYGAGAMGSAVSHISLWQDCAKGVVPFHIAEDDALIRDDFFTQASTVLNRRPGWDIVLWSYNYNWPVALCPASGTAPVVLNGPDGDPATIRTQKAEFQAGRREPVLLPLISAAGIGCYSISPQGAGKLLKACLPLAQKPARYALDAGTDWINGALDVEMSRHYEKLEAFLAFPPLALMVNDETASTIRGRHRAEAEPVPA